MTVRSQILEVRNLVQHFRISDSYTACAVNGISFSIFQNEVLGLVGESGCGKSTVARSISGIYTPTKGEIFYEGTLVSGKGASHAQRERMQREVQMVFQDSAASLNPRMTVEKILLEPLRIQKQLNDPQLVKARNLEMLSLVGMPDSCLFKRPGELSGGQRQRIAIARSLMLYPKLLIADEPVASLDVSIQAQIINLLIHCKEDHHFSMLFIAHDLSLVRFISDRVAVMLKGKVVEIAPTEELFTNPLHPYTQSLLSAVHVPDPVLEQSRKRIDYDRTLPLGDTMQEYGKEHFVLEPK